MNMPHRPASALILLRIPMTTLELADQLKITHRAAAHAIWYLSKSGYIHAVDESRYVASRREEIRPDDAAAWLFNPVLK